MALGNTVWFTCGGRSMTCLLQMCNIHLVNTPEPIKLSHAFMYVSIEYWMLICFARILCCNLQSIHPLFVDIGNRCGNLVLRQYFPYRYYVNVGFTQKKWSSSSSCQSEVI